MKRIDRRRILLGAAAVALVPRASDALPAGKVYRIGILTSAREPAAAADIFPQWMRTLRRLGRVEGQNVVFERRFSAGKADLLPELARQLVRANVDVIATFGDSDTVAAMRATSSIPIVMMFSGVDPVQQGLITSFGRPGGNITGVSRMLAETDAKRMELIKATQPLMTRIGVLANARSVAGQANFERRIGAAARNLGVEAQFFSYRNQEDVEAAFPAMAGMRVQSFVLEPHFFTYRNRARIAALALQHRLPGAFTLIQYVQAGGLMSYGPNWAGMEEQHAGFIDRILKGANPAGLPIEQPKKFELSINLKTAQALGLTIPQSLLLRADEIFQ